ncbi:hypothetical protein BGZ63DRAFT_244341 [Mariannaea sp. PMI_226]|nr:hypothetical protein BGZ63DRAFT_244341 [Mariannaea sp. PMI_226]
MLRYVSWADFLVLFHPSEASSAGKRRRGRKHHSGSTSQLITNGLKVTKPGQLDDNSPPSLWSGSRCPTYQPYFPVQEALLSASWSLAKPVSRPGSPLAHSQFWGGNGPE